MHCDVTHELRGGDGNVFDLAPAHEYRVDRAVRLPEVDLEGVGRRREEALVGRVKRDAPEMNVNKERGIRITWTILGQVTNCLHSPNGSLG